MEIENKDGQHSTHQNNTVNVRIRYITARDPFVDPHVRMDESLATLKNRALDFFKLIEGDVEGGTKTYQLALDGTVLTNLNVTVGSLTKDKHEIKFDLIECLVQG